MNAVDLSRCARASSCADTSADSTSSCCAPLVGCDDGRRRSDGSSSTPGAPVSALFQYPSSLARCSPLSRSRCHSA